jgi:hypothetical protein
MARVGRLPPHVDVPEIFQRNVRQLPTLPVNKYAFGVALWASAELGLLIPDKVMQHIQGVIRDEANWSAFRAQDLGMILVGVAAQCKGEKEKWASLAAMLFRFLRVRYHAPSGLFYDAAAGLRRRYASFATQTYLVLACYAFGELMNDNLAIQMANRCARKLIDLQGANGEWPWFFDAQTGRVLDFYEVYSVHQYGMAPAFLQHAERHGVAGARDAIVRGFKWVLGDNQLRQPMVIPQLSLSIRSHVRRGELRTKRSIVVRAILNSMLGTEAALVHSSKLALRLECRSYELGWILWSFGARSDLTELTGHKLFMTSANPGASPHDRV